MLYIVDISNYMNFVKSNIPSLKHKQFTTSGCKDIVIRKKLLLQRLLNMYIVHKQYKQKIQLFLNISYLLVTYIFK